MKTPKLPQLNIRERLQEQNTKRIVIGAAAAGVVAAVVALGAAFLGPRVFGSSRASNLASGVGYVPPTNTLLEGPTISDYMMKICIPEGGQPNLPKPTLSTTVNPDGGGRGRRGWGSES